MMHAVTQGLEELTGVGVVAETCDNLRASADTQSVVFSSVKVPQPAAATEPYTHTIHHTYQSYVARVYIYLTTSSPAHDPSTFS